MGQEKMSQVDVGKIWVGQLGAVAVAVATIIGYLHSTFQTKSEAALNRDQMIRIEEKLDLLLINKYEGAKREGYSKPNT